MEYLAVSIVLTSPMPRIKFIIRGDVQGVGFRHFARLEAERLSITGYAKNRIDGSVDIEAQGEKIVLEEFTRSIYIGPRQSIITEVLITDIHEKNETGFRVSF